MRAQDMPARIYLSPPHLTGEELALVREAFASNWIAPLGPHVEAFEREFAAKVGIRYALAVASGTAALHLALRCLGVNAGDEVLCPSLTFIGGVSPVVFQGATPVFIDSDPSSWTVSPHLLADELEICRKKGKLPKAVIVTDIYGQPVDLDLIVGICEPYGIPVIADSAEALGSVYKNRSVGAGAYAAVFSFNGNKIITTSGGGMLVSDDQRLIDHARYLSQQARDPAPHYEHSEIGYNYRMSNVLAAIGRAQLRALEQRVERRRAIFDFYRKTLADLPGIGFMPEVAYGRSNRWLTVITVDPLVFGADRETIRLALEEQNIESRPVWKPMHLQPAFRGCRMRGGAVCEDLFRKGLCLPSGTAMTDQDLRRVASVIRQLGTCRRLCD